MVNEGGGKQLFLSKLISRFSAQIDPENRFGIEDKLSQINTLQQLVNIASHGFLHEFLARNQVHLHALWFDVYSGDMYMFSRDKERFVLIDEESAAQLLTEDERERSREYSSSINVENTDQFRIALGGAAAC